MAVENKTTQEIMDIVLKWRSRYSAEKMGDLTPNEVSALKVIVTHNDKFHTDIKMSELSDHIEATKPATSQLVNRLEEKELIERFMTKEDRRVVYVKLTDKGREYYEINRTRLMDFLDYLMQEMGEGEAKELLRLFNRYREIERQYIQDHTVEA